MAVYQVIRPNGQRCRDDASGTVPLGGPGPDRPRTALTPARRYRSQGVGARSRWSAGRSHAHTFCAVIVGPESDEWTSTVWRYEQCIFASGVMSAGEFASLLTPGPRSVTLGVVTFQLDLAPNQFGWQRKPSRALYDQCQFDWPSEIHTPGLVSQGGADAAAGYLVGAGETHSFPVFSAAFGAYFYDDFSVSGTQNPLLGQLSIRVLDDRGRIDGVDPAEGGVQVLLDGTGLVGTVLEFKPCEQACHPKVGRLRCCRRVGPARRVQRRELAGAPAPRHRGSTGVLASPGSPWPARRSAVR